MTHYMAMTTHELPGGLKVRTRTLPPDDFDPLTADDRRLLVHGYPARPENPALRARWERALRRPMRHIKPTFRPIPLAVKTSANWSGAAATAPDLQFDPFQWVEGTWNVPNVYPPTGAADGIWYSASPWIGLWDGGSSVLRAGCAVRADTAQSRNVWTWWQWTDGSGFAVDNFPVAQGDTVNCLICMTGWSTRSATIYLHNLTSAAYTQFDVSAPAGEQLLAGQAVWAVEGFADRGAPELARYGNVYFDEANAGTVHDEYFPAGTGDTIDLVSNGSVVSSGRIETNTLVQVRYTGSD